METLTELLAIALDGENACVHCHGAVPVTAAAIGFVTRLHADGDLEALDPEGLRMLLLLGSVDAGCGLLRDRPASGLRVSCPSCATPTELALAARMAGGLPAPAPSLRR
jgi:hypothetical protein